MTRVNLEDLPLLTKICNYIPYFITLVFSYSREGYMKFVAWLSGGKSKELMDLTPAGEEDLAPLIKRFNSFFERWLYRRIMDLFARPIKGVPGGYCDVFVLEGKDETIASSGHLIKTDKTQRCLNLSSYNYLGFAENSGGCLETVMESVKKFGVAGCSPRTEVGTTTVHRQLEKLTAEYLGKEDSITFGMGYATNSTTLPALCKKGDLIISDMLNHASIIVGCRSSGATIKVFKHNDPQHLEAVVRKAIIDGQPRTHRPWNKILIVVEGIYSMEGEILRLPEILAIKKKYNCYLYVDEAHSIGALGKTGRGICEYWGVDPKEVDILMGTFTKSFCAAGGYLCSSKHVIDYLRLTAFSSVSDVAMPVPVAQQIISSLTVILGKDGTDEGSRRLKKLHENTVFFRKKLKDLGFLIIGSGDSPVIPLMMLHPVKMSMFSRMCLEKNIAVVIASYPATELELSRARFCVSAGHNIEDLEHAAEVMAEIGDVCQLRYSPSSQLYQIANIE